MYHPPSTPIAGRTIPRDIAVLLFEKAYAHREFRFLRQATLSWLAAYPGDLRVNLLYAKVLMREGHPEQALPILTRLTQTDPEWLEAAQARLEAAESLRKDANRSVKGNGRRSGRQSSIRDLVESVQALGGNPQISGKSEVSKNIPGSAWGAQIRNARQLIKNHAQSKGDDQLDEAEQMVNATLPIEVGTPLVAVTHIELLQERNADNQSLRNIVEHYHQKWPDCVFFQLILAETLVNSGETDRAVAYLHRVAANDTAGQVAKRLWGKQHAYHNLWPTQLRINLDVQIPASLLSSVGWNQLTDGQTAYKTPEIALNPPVVKNGRTRTKGRSEAGIFGDLEQDVQYDSKRAEPEILVSIQQELERIAERLNLPGLTKNDGRYPVYVVMTTRQGLEMQYGAAAANELDATMRKLVQAVEARPDWHAMLYYADQGIPGKVRQARYNDPWAIKLALADLDKTLSHKGEMIGAVLIVGGPEIVPFHCLPNPVDDMDDDVASDNPYGTRDENYFIPEWPVGRLPGGKSSSPGLLSKTLQQITEAHTRQAKAVEKYSWSASFWKFLTGWLRSPMTIPAAGPRKTSSFGYTAAVWKNASTQVFRPIGEPRALKISPPVGTDTQLASLPTARLGYFNLHGLIDAVEWYGQSDTSSAHSTSVDIREYPVAVRPQDVVNSGHAPEVVFSEACYGAHILNKDVEEALALKFLHSGSQAVVGSTATAYGSISSPLTAADLLGHSFWDNLRAGASAGEALRRARLTLAREMHTRQGYLDGEDQKTLISFVLYGDPLAQPIPAKVDKKSVLRTVKPFKGVRTVCDRATAQDHDSTVPSEMTEYVKKIVKNYLPTMQGARIALCQEHSYCQSDEHVCPTKQLHPHGALNSTQPAPGRKLVVLSKEVPGIQHTHHMYARVTLDQNNKVVKIVVSR